MKKIFILLICIILCLTSCKKKPPVTTSNKTTDSTTSDIIVEWECLYDHMDNYQEYLDYMSKIDKENFISYNDISFLGDFEGFTMFTWPYGYTAYGYDLVDNNGIEIRINIYDDYKEKGYFDMVAFDHKEIATELLNEGKLWEKIPDYCNKKVILGDITYIYYDDFAAFVSWCSENYAFFISCYDYTYLREELAEKGVEFNESFVGSLLYTETAHDAIEEFNTMINKIHPE